MFDVSSLPVLTCILPLVTVETLSLVVAFIKRRKCVFTYCLSHCSLTAEEWNGRTVLM